MQPLSRVTAATRDVLAVLLEHRDACWGLIVIKQSGRPPGTVYPILDRLETLGWITSSWEEANERSGPRRRYIRLTDDGAVQAAQVVRTARSRAPRTEMARTQTARTGAPLLPISGSAIA
jgi:DNA-binding MarR family transcriptional regulator